MRLSQFVTEREWTEVVDEIKDLLKETYHISESEAESILSKSRDRADGFIEDYMPYIRNIQDIRGNMRDMLDSQLMLTVDKEQELTLKMRNDAAVWLTFECMRRYCKKIPY